MPIKRMAFVLGAIALGQAAQAQTTYVPLWAKENWMLERLEIKAQTNNTLNLSTVKPYMRKTYTQVADSIRLLLLEKKNPLLLSKVDEYNIDRFEANNSEYSRFDVNSMPQWKSKKDFLGTFWATKGNAVEVNTKDFYLSANPAVNEQQSVENDYDKRVYVNSKCITVRGLIAQKIGFNFFLTDNQEQGPAQFRSYVSNMQAVPGGGYWKYFKTDRGVDYFDARGSVTWNVSKYVNMQFGYDQQFIGNGYRSLFLSNFAPPNLFLKWNTRIGKFNYTNLFTEMFVAQTVRGDRLYHRKYMSMHHLSVNVLPWLNIGAFESMIFGEKNAFKATHLQPVIFLNTLAARKGGENNANIGFDFKANLVKQVQLYGQYLFDNLDGIDGKTGSNWWGSRNAFQLGAKYVDVLGIKNLDVQAEVNQIRPFTYSGGDSVVDYTNYRQSLAHPMGANLRELIGIIRYQPMPRLYLFARVNSWKQGLDSMNYSFGANLLRNNSLVTNGGSRLREGDYALFSGIESKGLNAAFTASYELKENLFIDLGFMYRSFDKADAASTKTTTATLGFRWNMFRRDYDY